MQYTTTSNRSAFDTYTKAAAFLNTIGKTYQRPVSVHPFGSVGDDQNIIGMWCWNDDPVVANRRIIPYGPIRFDKVTLSQYALVTSAAGVDLTLTAGYVWISTSGTLRVWNQTDGTEIGDYTYSRSGGTVNVGAVAVGLIAAAIGAGKVIRVWDTNTELQIGNSTRDIQLTALAIGYFDASGLTVTGIVALPLGGTYRKTYLTASLSSYTTPSADGKRCVIGWRYSAADSRGGGFSKTNVGTINLCADNSGIVDYSSGAVMSGQATSVYIAPGGGLSSSLYLRGGAFPTTIATTGKTPLAISEDLWVNVAIPYLRADDGAVFGGLSCETSAQVSADAYHTSYDDLVAYLNTKTNTYKQAVPLYKIGYAGNQAYIIGHWAWNSESTPTISPVGPINFGLVTASGRGVVQTVHNSTTVTVVMGHTLSASGYLREWDVSAAAELRDSAFTVVGDIVTVSDTTGLVAGDILYQTGASEFTIGNTARNLQPAANVTAYFTGSGLYLSGGMAKFTPLGVYRKSRLTAGLTSYTALGTVEDRVMVGWSAAASLIAGGICRNGTDARIFTAYSTTSGTVEPSIGAGGGGSAVNGAQTTCGITHTLDYSTGEAHWSAICSSLGTTFTGQGAAIPAAGLANAVGYFRANLAATFSGVSCEASTSLPATVYCTSYSEVVAYLTLKGNTDKTAVPLYKIGNAGNSAYIIGHWQWSNDAVPVIVPVGPVRFDLLTDSGWGQVASVGGPTTLNLNPGHTMGLAGSVRLWNTVSATEYAGGGAYTRSGDVLTVPDTTGMVAGDQVYGVGTSEFSIGNSTRDIQPLANSVCRIAAGGLSLVGRAIQRYGGLFRNIRLSGAVLSYNNPTATNKRIMVGWYVSGAVGYGGGMARHSNGNSYTSHEIDFGVPTTQVIVLNLTSVICGTHNATAPAPAGTDYTTLYGTASYAGATNGGTNSVYNPTYATALPYLCAEDGAVFSGLNCDISSKIQPPAYYTTYDEVLTFLNLQGNTYKQAVPLYKKGYAGNPAYIIGQWKWTSDAAPVIAAVGEIRFDLVTASQYGVIASVDSPTQCTLTGGHNLPASSTVRVWDTSGAVELFDGVSAAVAVNTLTMVSTAGMAAGDQVYVLNVSEFTIGGTTRNIRMLAGSTASFTGAMGLTATGIGTLCNFGAIGRSTDFMASFTMGYARSVVADGQYAYIGFVDDVALARHFVAGLLRNAGADKTGGNFTNILAPAATATDVGSGVWSSPGRMNFFRSYPLGGAATNYCSGASFPARGATAATGTITQAPVYVALVSKPAAAETISVSMISATFG